MGKKEHSVYKGGFMTTPLHFTFLFCVASFLNYFYQPKISLSQFFFQILTMVLKENVFSLVGITNGNLVSEWLIGIDISNAVFTDTS